MTFGPLTIKVARHHTVYSTCCGHPENSHTPGEGTISGLPMCESCFQSDSRARTMRHRYEPIELASGGVAGPDGYLDCRAAWLCDTHNDCMNWERAVERACIDACAGGEAWLVATGNFGALLLGAGYQPVGRGLLWTPKDHGLPCSPFPPPPAGTRVVLVEDVVTTPNGGTLSRMRSWCEDQGFKIVGEVIASAL